MSTPELATVLPDVGARFAWPDWLVLAVYIIAVLAIGFVVRRRAAGRDEFFLAGRSMPLGAVAISVLATSLSAATFIGGPQQAYTSNLTYFSANLGGLLAVIVVALLFVPAYYRLGVTSVYELLGHHFGRVSRTAASGMFLIGRVFASGARLFMVALPFALIAFGDTRPPSLLVSIGVITVVAAAYTMAGGIRAVIWTDVLQTIVVVGTVGIALALLWARIPAAPGVVLDALRDGPDGNKLTVLDFSLDPRRPYTLWTALVGFTLFNLAAFGTDQDLTQRLLTCRSARSGAWSIILANVMSWPVILLFLALGLLLHVYYARPDVMGVDAPRYEIGDSRRVFLVFMLAELPAGLRGLMAAGIFAAAMSSLDSALNAMASITVADFYRPWRDRRGASPEDDAAREGRVSRLAILGWAVVLGGFAGACVFWQAASGQTLIDFALGVMVFAYGGLLGVFLTALLTRRGNATSTLAALATGFIAVALMRTTPLAFPWQMVVATTLSFAVACAGKRLG